MIGSNSNFPREECDRHMYKKFLLPLLQAEQRIKEYRHKEQWIQVRNISLITIAAFFIMSIVNLLQHEYVMLATTLLGGGCMLYFLISGWKDQDTKSLEMVFLFLFMVLCTYYILFGGSNGFAVLWVIFIPFLFPLMIDVVKGFILSTYFLLLLFLVFYGPLGFLLHYDYSPVMLVRFPLLYAIDCILSFYCAQQMFLARSNLILAEDQARQASFLDAATGLKNRTAFTHFVETSSDKNFIRLSVIYIDVNGLHELNNRLGHAAGDEMLRFVARACVKHFPKADVFRLGGDEFLMICSVGTEGEIKKWLTELNDEIEAAGYTIAYGVEHRLHDFDLEDMVNKADSKMLKNKADFYRERDRRRR